MADAVLAIKIVTDFTQGQAGIRQADTAVGRMQGRLDKLAVPAGAAALAIGAFGKRAIDSASRLQQAMGAVDSVFGKSADQVKSWAKDSADSVGLAQSEYAELAAGLGAQLKNMGVPMKDVAGRTNELVKLGSDLSATYGGTTKEAVEALGSALRGETDPIERYGVSVKQADIAAQQAKDGTDKLTGAAGKQAKTMALLKLVNKQTADAQGQFAREADSAAGASQRNAAKVEDMQAALGTALLPVVAAVADQIGKLADLMARNTKATQVIIGVIAGLAVAILAANAALRVYVITTKVVAAVQKATWLSNPIFLVVAAIVLLGVALVVAYRKSARFRAVVDALWRGLKAGARAAGQALKAIWSVVWKVLSVYVKIYVTAFRVAFKIIQTIVKVVTRALRGDFSGAWAALRAGVRAVVGIIKEQLRGVSAVARTIVGAIKSLFSGLWGALKAGARGVGDALAAPFRAVRDAAESAIGWVDRVIDAIARIKIPDAVAKIAGKVGLLSLPPAPPPTGAYVAPTGRSGRLAAVPTAAATSSGGGPTFIIQGAIDPEATARQIRRILGGHERRVGLA